MAPPTHHALYLPSIASGPPSFWGSFQIWAAFYFCFPPCFLPESLMGSRPPCVSRWGGRVGYLQTWPRVGRNTGHIVWQSMNKSVFSNETGWINKWGTRVSPAWVGWARCSGRSQLTLKLYCRLRQKAGSVGRKFRFSRLGLWLIWALGLWLLPSPSFRVAFPLLGHKKPIGCYWLVL